MIAWKTILNCLRGCLWGCDRSHRLRSLPWLHDLTYSMLTVNISSRDREFLPHLKKLKNWRAASSARPTTLLAYMHHTHAMIDTTLRHSWLLRVNDHTWRPLQQTRTVLNDQNSDPQDGNFIPWTILTTLSVGIWTVSRNETRSGTLLIKGLTHWYPMGQSEI